ncbi:MAG: pyruvate, water dikinase regulatory protein [Gallionella sp.]|nr:pyruvate, water dikinase regulatory protein [Gallionella sp.]
MKAASRTIIYISDGTGITAETLGKGLLSQFEGIEFRYVRYPFTDGLEKAAACLRHIADLNRREGVRPLLVMTMTDPQISALLRQADALLLDVFEAFIGHLEQELGQRATRVAGRSHGQESREYAQRIAAMNFAMAHDDGISSADLKNADVILVGVSRSGKTPASLYLSLHFGLKAANYPLIPEDFERDCLPASLLPFHDKLFGLTIAPEQLHRIREERRPGSHYASLENCRFEVAAAESLMRRAGIAQFDMTARSIEEMAVHLLQAIRKRSHSDS